MDWKKFLAANSFIFGTVIIIVGFIWMITQSLVVVPFEQTLTAFFFTVSGIIFWWLGIRYNPKATPFSE